MRKNRNREAETGIPKTFTGIRMMRRGAYLATWAAPVFRWAGVDPKPLDQIIETCDSILRTEGFDQLLAPQGWTLNRWIDVVQAGDALEAAKLGEWGKWAGSRK